jgi:hypothetical protein
VKLNLRSGIGDANPGAALDGGSAIELRENGGGHAGNAIVVPKSAGYIPLVVGTVNVLAGPVLLADLGIEVAGLLAEGEAQLRAKNNVLENLSGLAGGAIDDVVGIGQADRKRAVCRDGKGECRSKKAVGRYGAQDKSDGTGVPLTVRASVRKAGKP